MPFTRYNFPASFRMLRPDLCIKAIEIGNLLLDAGYKENVAEIIAFSNAKIWPSYSINAEGERKLNVHLVPHPEGWALIPGDASCIYFVSPAKNEALSRARSLAKNKKLKLYIHSPIGNICDAESFVVNRPSSENLSRTAYPSSTQVASDLSVLPSSRRDSIRGSAWISKSSDDLVTNSASQIEV